MNKKPRCEHRGWKIETSAGAGKKLKSRSLFDWLGLWQVVRAAAFFPGPIGLHDLDTLASLEDAALGTDAAAGILETAMLGHKIV